MSARPLAHSFLELALIICFAAHVAYARSLYNSSTTSITSSTSTDDSTLVNPLIRTSVSATRVTESLAFRRSPQCTSSELERYQSKGNPIDTTKGIWTFSVEEGTTGTFEVPWTYQGNAKDKHTLYLTLEGPTSTVFSAPDRFDYQKSLSSCCGKCFLTVSSVDVRYWPTATADDKNLITSAPSYDQSVVSDGYTYYSPSVYLSYGLVQAFDDCGNHGPTFESIIVPLDPKDLITVNNLNKKTAERNRVHFDELSCAPNSFVVTTSGSKEVTSWCSIFLAPVSKLYDLDPSFKSCLIQNGGYDPYFALSTRPPLAPTVETTESAEDPTVIPTPYVPIAMPEHPVSGPKETLPPAVPKPVDTTKPSKPSTPSKPHVNLDPQGSGHSDPQPNHQTSPQPNGQDPPLPTVVVSRKVLPGSKSVYVVGSQTLQASGPAVTVSGAVLSLDNNGGGIVVKYPKSKEPAAATPSSPSDAGPYTVTTSRNIGDMILSVWNGPVATVSADAPVSYGNGTWNGTIIQVGRAGRNSFPGGEQVWQLLLVAASAWLWVCI